MARKEADKVSCFLDSLIDKTRGGSEDTENYDRFSRELARLNRFQRRCLSKGFLSARINANNGKCFCRMVSMDGVTYCFLFQDSFPNPSYRLKTLFAIFQIERSMYLHNKKVLGIATEPNIQAESYYDFVLLDNIDWADEDQKRAEKIKEDLSFFKDSVETPSYENEYLRPSQD